MNLDYQILLKVLLDGDNIEFGELSVYDFGDDSDGDEDIFAAYAMGY